MPFRDDREAMRERTENLEAELSRARADLERLEGASREAQELRERLAKLERDRSSVGAPQPRREGRTATAIVGAAVLIAGIVYVVRQQAAALRERAAVQTARPEGMSTEAVRVLADEARAEANAAQPAPRPLPPMRTFELSWPAKVRRSDGGPVRPGAACAIHGTVSTDGNRTNASADVVCGATTLYDWKDSPGSGLQMRSCTVSQTTDAEGDAYSLRCSDLGARTGRPQLSIDTALGTAAVWRDGGFRVDLSVRGPARHEGERISIESRVGMTVFGAIVRAGHVSRTFGEHTVRRGTACAVVVTTGEAPHPCRVNVQCGDRTLYGGGGSNGFASCDVVDGAPRRVTDENPSSRGGDPKLDLDLEARRVTISDEGPDWSVTIDLQ